MLEIMSITSALSDANRVRALCVLEAGELCVCQLIELLDLAPSTVSKHLSILKQARLIEGRKDGRWMYYRLAGDDAPAAARDAVKWVLASLEQDATRREDQKLLRHILRQDPEELCRRQMGRSCCPPTKLKSKTSESAVHK